MRNKLITLIIITSLIATSTTTLIAETKYDNTSPEIIINFAGNPGDKGGPFWQPPGESIWLCNHSITQWQDGYYTNDSRQIEDWIYINVTVTDSESEIANVTLYWTIIDDFTPSITFLNFNHTIGDFWEINTSGIIDMYEGTNYTFDVYAIDSAGNNNTVSWMKEGLNGPTRRYVQLNCTPTSIEYEPFYYFDIDYGWEDKGKDDRLHHDQSSDGSITDTAYLLRKIPTDYITKTKCDLFVAGWFDESVCIEEITIKNIYYHFWISNKAYGVGSVSWKTTRSYPKPDPDSLTEPFELKRDIDDRSYLYFDNGWMVVDNNYYLYTHLQDLSYTPTFTDNSIYEFYLNFFGPFRAPQMDPLTPPTFPSVISNRSFISFALINVPDNKTLNISYYDSDSDGLSDWTELYRSYTNPFLKDTDDDGATDYEEIHGAEFGYQNSDPNDYLDTTEFRNSNPIASAHGPYASEFNEPIQFTGSAVEGSPPYTTWLWDFGDDTYSTDQNPQHTYAIVGNYTVTLTVTDSEDNIGQDTTIVIIPFLAPETPKRPTGPLSGKPNAEYTYTTVTTDPKDLKLSYLFDWGDETDSEWTVYVPSGEEASASHVWDEQGVYEIKVKAKNTDGAESQWSDPLAVTMPQNKNNIRDTISQIIQMLFERFPILEKLLEFIGIQDDFLR